jgi:hypothetical protein
MPQSVHGVRIAEKAFWNLSPREGQERPAIDWFSLLNDSLDERPLLTALFKERISVISDSHVDHASEKHDGREDWNDDLHWSLSSHAICAALFPTIAKAASGSTPDKFYKGRSQEKTPLLQLKLFLLLSPIDGASSVLTGRTMCSVA